jgi:hypothetical protein
MKKLGRSITSLLLTAIYLLIVFTPLAPFAMQSKFIAHAVTGECSGDCRIDGCSPERSASHTCCCWQKKRAEGFDAHQQVNSGCCCAQKADTPRKTSGCCGTSPRQVHDESVTASAAGDGASRKQRTIVSNAPCGTGKLFTLSSGEQSWHLPFQFSKEITSPEQSSLSFIPPDSLLSRHGDPPDPPPILS